MPHAEQEDFTHRTIYVCDICGKGYDSMTAATIHELEEHKEER